MQSPAEETGGLIGKVAGGTEVADVTEEAFTAYPGGARVFGMRNAVNRDLRRDLATHCKVAAKVLPGSVKRVAPLIDGLDVAQRLNPLAFTYHYQLAAGLRQQSAGRVVTALGFLAHVLETAPYGQAFRVERLGWDPAVSEMTAFLCGPEGPRTSRGEYPEIWAPGDDAHRRSTEWIARALPLLRELDPDLMSEFDVLVDCVRLFRGRAVHGISSIRCFGLVLLGVPYAGPAADEPVLYFLDNITHETSHLVLHTLMNADPLITNGHSERYSAPIRSDLRPLYGIYHATFVLSRVIRVISRFAKHDGRQPVLTWLERQYASFRSGLATLDRHAAFTPMGDRVIASCRTVVEESVGCL